MVRLAVAGVFVQHVGRSCLNLRVDDLLPKPSSLDRFASPAFLLVLGVELLELFAVTLKEAWALIWAHQSPLFIFLYSLHKEIRYPEGVEKISSPILFLSMIFSKLKKIIDIRMPGLYIDSEGTLSFATALVNVASSVIEDFEHRN